MIEDCFLEDCPICLEEMQEEDLTHPLQCQHHCGYNFCQGCIESLIVSSKDDYMEASDGNRHVKVFLHCPNCRSNLSATIRDTLLLRKADTVRRIVKQQQEQEENGFPEEEKHEVPIELTESQKRLLDVLNTTQVKDAIKKARKLEAEYMGMKRMETLSWSLRSSGASSCSNASLAQLRQEALASSFFTSIDEWGIEADLIHGVHESFRMPRVSNKNKREESKVDNSVKEDATLFAGLEDFLNGEQKKQITMQMTSGDPNQLAAAALELWHVLHDDGHGTSTMSDNNTSSIPDRRQRLSKRSSVFQLIAEAQEAHEKQIGANGGEEKKTAELLDQQYRVLSSAQSATENERRSLVGSNLKRQVAFQKAFPLPVRMPKTVELQVSEDCDSHNQMIQLVDYEWDGTVIDAFRKISIGFLGNVNQQSPPRSNQGVQRILGRGLDGQVEFPGQKRVLILEAGRQAGRQGAVRGDVVTHINGQPVHEIVNGADAKAEHVTAADVERKLMLLLQKQQYQRQGRESKVDKIMVTLNAERSVAEALQRRAWTIAREEDQL